MEGTVFMGTFGVRDKKFIKSLPMRNDSGLWQAWETADGNFLIQPLNYEQAPWGSPALLDQNKFYTIFSEVQYGKAEMYAHGGITLRADSPDLLSIWYAQATGKIGAKKQGKSDAASSENKKEEDEILAFLADSMGPDSPAKEQQEIIPMWEPDELQKEEIKPVGDETLFSVLQEATDAAEPLEPIDLPELPVLEPKGGASLAPPPDWSQEQEHTASLPSFSTAQKTPAQAAKTSAQKAPILPPLRIEEDDPHEEERAQRLEESMRNEFESLVSQLDEGPHPMIEGEISRLLLRGASFTWKQKFMFTEFGMALRRKHAYDLALAAHMRALAFSPSDENILFNVARAEYELGNIESARGYLQRSLQSAPDFTAAKNFLAFLSVTIAKK